MARLAARPRSRIPETAQCGAPLLGIALAVGILYAAGRVVTVPLAAMLLAGIVAMLGSTIADADRKSRLLAIALLSVPLLLAPRSSH